MSQTNAIILRMQAERAQDFEALFKAEVYPLWEEFKESGNFIAASLTPVIGGTEQRAGVQAYILHVEVPVMADHEQFDSDPRFLEFLKKVRADLQAEDPSVWLGSTLFQV